jgi:hypothetical protein
VDLQCREQRRKPLPDRSQRRIPVLAFAEEGPLRATMGENSAWTPALRLKGEAPLPARWTIVKDGEAIARVESRTLDWPVPAAGNYRVELALLVGDEGWLDWIYANPVRVLSAAN